MQNIRSVSSGSSSTPLRVILLVAVVGLALGLLVPALGASEPGDLAPASVHVVKPAETLWKIAKTYAPDSDPRSYIYDIQQVNGLSGATITPGQKLILP
jgi:LysM repeat protein